MVKKYFLPKALKKDREYQRLAKKADKALKDFQDAVNVELKRLKTPLRWEMIPLFEEHL